MAGYLLKNCAAVIVDEGKGPAVHRNVDLLTDGPAILAIGENLGADALPAGTTVQDAAGWFVYPGLVNTHHHFFQCFVRNRADLDWTKLSVIEWLDRIYPIFSQLNEECFYHSSVTAMAEMIKHGCTTAFDHQYNFPRHAGKRLIDRQFEAADLLGMRFHAGRGGNTLPKSEGSTIPDEMLETTDEFIADCARLIETYHDTSPFSMRQVVVAPCQPVNCYRETFVESVALARDHGVMMHTHVGEGESPVIQARHGMRTVDYLEELGFAGPDAFYAHCWELTHDELRKMAASGTGVAHCPEPVYLVGAEVTDIPAMAAFGLRIGLGCDGAASNDNSNLMHCLHSSYMLQCLVASGRAHPVPPPVDFLGYGTSGGASLLGRRDIGRLAPGMAADLFAIDTRRMDYVGTRHDPLSLIARVGIGMATDMTMINGRIVWQKGEFPGLDEAKLSADAEAALSAVEI
ncbi:hydroxyatrazine ethylaminohydrolase [Rhizobium leguminosarum]|uniref:Hydroxyatrazine ethylaminohydrolase n=1 Tax=Rhizobium leguminosarum TaxID=384 RepID=A0AAE2MS31_RHILE|nr:MULTISPECIES: amidohydrolase [Rhizobium]MBB4293989.1 hydroxyatrazine ethylaminohydrolase [Rhizobium leguminosarum]MBB4300400.1 hydroxyatrazine ethylaminohydrolase [Rhizobium leguminosarum]MBB4311695.1 hydroxyatrazine ethylaminohydrolase [Rhizobium leguminosarum]MBB4420665.1 hydroxyatrazine ethylaminohydrolase [Rhizobium leguminosarum]MBB4435903.1 hydroxyatrazine ethylaminohydrolase [Rhizobium esperanzae]